MSFAGGTASRRTMLRTVGAAGAAAALLQVMADRAAASTAPALTGR